MEQPPSLQKVAPEYFRPWLRPLMDLVFPRHCAVCRGTIIDSSSEALCEACSNRLQPTEHVCLRCSAPVPRMTTHRTRCYYCKSRHWAFQRAYCYTVYRGLEAKAARLIKEPGHEPLAIAMGDRVACWLAGHPTFDADRIDWIIPVPQHWWRRMTHRYNQAEVLAERIARGLCKPLKRHWLFRSRWTEKQGTKTIEERRRSIRNSFGCLPRSAIANGHVLLVDDIVTSGATAHEGAMALRHAGARRVDVVAFARGVGASIHTPTPAVMVTTPQ